MSTQSITSATSSSQYSGGSALSSLGNGALQITGLASGLNTNAVVQALMAAQQQQVTNLQNQQSGITALNKQLTSIQTALQQVSEDAQALADPSLFANTQTTTSTNSTLVGATAIGSNGAVVGSYQVAVSALASASQRTFSFTSPSSADTITIDGHDTYLVAGASATNFVNAINNDKNASVWATVTGTDPSTNKPVVVLSERATGQPPSTNAFVTITGDSAQALSEQPQYAAAGTDAAYTINGGQTQYSSSNTVTGVSLGGSTPTGSRQGRHPDHPRRHAQPQRPDRINSGDRHSGDARSQHPEHPDRGPEVRHGLQLRDQPDPDAAGPDAEQLRPDAGNPVRRHGASAAAGQHAPDDGRPPSTG